MSTRRISSKTIPTAATEGAAVHKTATSSRNDSRVTPRNSTVNEDAALAKETPYNALSQLSRVINNPITPSGRASSTGPPSTRHSTRRTPIGQERTPGRITQPGSTRRPMALTPHAQAALKANDLRRTAAMTPGKDRRRSGRHQQRDTPQEPLRALSRLLAPISKAVDTTPPTDVSSAGKVRIAHENDLDDRTEPIPRLSMALDDEDDSLLLPPIRSANFTDDENLTQRSVELPRRAEAGQSIGRQSRGSFGSVGTSDRLSGFNELGLDAVAASVDDSSFLPQGEFDSFEGARVEEDATGAMQRPYLEDGTEQISLASRRATDITPQMIPEDDTETTFLLPLPQRDSLVNRPSRGEIEGEEEDEEEFDDFRDQSADSDDWEDPDINRIQVEERDKTMAHSSIAQSEKVPGNRTKSKRIKKRIKVSKHGIQYPSLPVGVVKRLTATFLKTSGSGSGNAKLSKSTLEAIMQASEWFFEQVSDDLGIYAQHANRKTIDETDVMTLMKRQRQTSITTTPFALAQRYLPRELLQEFRMVQPTLSRPRKGRQLETVDEED